MKIYVPWRVCLENIECEVENVWKEFFTYTWNTAEYLKYYNSQPDYKNVELVSDNRIKYELLVSNYSVEVNTMEELLSILYYFNMFDPKDNSLTMGDD
jgi:hypothetical protein